MPITHLASICRVLDVSADYILGLSDEATSLKNNSKKLTQK